MVGAQFGGAVICRGGRFYNPDNVALALDGVTTKLTLFMDHDMRVLGEVSIRGATIHQRVHCDGSTFDNETCKIGLAKNDDRQECKEEYTDRYRYSIFAPHLRTNGGMTFAKSEIKRTGFVSKGCVRLTDTEIGGSVEIRNAEMLCKGSRTSFGTALMADRIKVKGDLKLEESLFEGKIQFSEARIGGELKICFASIQQPNNVKVNMDHAETAMLNLFEENTLKKLNESSDNSVEMIGLVYHEIPAMSDNLLIKQIIKIFNKQNAIEPYEQLAQVLKDMGRETDARTVNIARQELITKKIGEQLKSKIFGLVSPEVINRKFSVKLDSLHEKVSFLCVISGILLPTVLTPAMFIKQIAPISVSIVDLLIRKLIKFIVSFGYKPYQSILMLFGLIVTGALIFNFAENSGCIFPTRYFIYTGHAADYANIDDKKYPAFNSLAYSVELALPFLDFDQNTHFVIACDTKLRWLFEVYRWFHTFFGWLFSILIVLSPTQWLRRD